jgi:virginiamycin B lyase
MLEHGQPEGEFRMRCLSRPAVIMVFMIFCTCYATMGQQSVRGTITGTVTADQGQVHAFRVAAHNLDRRLWYTVFTKNGQFVVPQALPGLYELTVEEPGYVSPKVAVYITPGESKTADIALKKRTEGARSGAGEYNEEGPARRNTGNVVYVDSMEDVYPPGPERDLLKQNCTGCHSDSLTTMHYTKDGFLHGIERMTETGPAAFPNVLALGRTIISNAQKEQLAEYLAKNFGPGMPGRKLRVDPLVLDEDVASKVIYVSYDVPADLPLATNQGPKVGASMVDGEIALRPGVPPTAMGHLQAAAISPVDGTVWFTGRIWNSMLGLNAKELDPAKRWRNYPIKGEWVAVSGVTVDSKGKVYWSELDGGMLGELDPATGKEVRYVIPQKGVGVGIMADKDDNIDFALIWGALFGRLDAKTHMIHTYPTPTPDNGIYGLAVDQQGNMWGAGWQKGTISKWDAETGVVKEYPVPDSWGQIRRIGVDSKGIVWASAYNTGYLVKLDPTTDKLSEYKLPMGGANPYDAWPDKSDNVWTSDETHSVMIKFDQETQKFTFYPMPQPHQSVPKVEVAADNTLWFGTRGEPIVTGVHFYPNGYTSDAPPLP